MILTEAFSDTVALRDAYAMFRTIIDDEDLIKEITNVLNNYQELAERNDKSNFGNDSLTVSKMYRRPLPCAVRFKLHKRSDDKDTGGSCLYTGPMNRPLVVFYVTTDEGVFTNGNGEELYASYHKLPEHLVRNIIANCWDDVIVHELSHAYDHVSIRRNYDKRIDKEYAFTSAAEREMKDVMAKEERIKNDEPFFRYANCAAETNARVPQSLLIMASIMLQHREENKPIPTFVQCLGAVLEEISIPYGAMVPDTRRRFIKRVHDMYSTLKMIFNSKNKELQDMDDVMSAFYEYYEPNNL